MNVLFGIVCIFMDGSFLGLYLRGGGVIFKVLFCLRGVDFCWFFFDLNNRYIGSIES